MRALKYILIIIAIVSIGLVALIPQLPRFVVRVLATSSGFNITYEKIRKITPNSVEFDGLRIVDPRRGLGLSSEDAFVKISWNGPDPRKAAVAFDLKRVHFVKEAAESGPSYDTLNGLVALPFSNNWLYDEISGSVSARNKEVTIRDFMAKSAKLKLSFNGEIGPKNRIRSNILIFFTDDLTSKIPPELTRLVLKDEDPGWKSLSVNVDGDYTMPSIQVSSKLFRLNIRVKDSELN